MLYNQDSNSPFSSLKIENKFQENEFKCLVGGKKIIGNINFIIWLGIWIESQNGFHLNALTFSLIISNQRTPN